MALWQNLKFKMAAFFYDGRHFANVKHQIAIIFYRASYTLHCW